MASFRVRALFMLFLSKNKNFSHHTLVISLPYEVNRETAKFLFCGGGILGFHCIIQCSECL
ncbi:hypothetical protein [cyanobacterium endosymbiont of Epithemia turgida]|uniref:hypothetical protein n=1 Tax=cyanobacterium endosymbiont of Epithemia turgida TaxID=718217 RepID=UPI0011AEBB70|nr:hypothetical protein [cyanobacterium endosymbiont of Epithemia turgida]